jgi:hypothetical protein
MKPIVASLNRSGAKGERWQLGAACTAGLLAMLAGIIALLGEQQSNLAIVNQVHATSQWSHYQAKSIRKNILQSRVEILDELGKPVPQDLLACIAEYDKDKESLSTEAWNAQAGTERHIRHHDTFSIGLTLFHIAIALVTIALMTRRRFFWFISIALGMAGCVHLLLGLLTP